MKPIYQEVMERGIQHAAKHATAATLGQNQPTPRTSSNTKVKNGKVKRS